ncbi:MAG: hypothetical protein HY824_15825 [Acidobacteria bacterium]|nr:hypothetical protein [Acidobacteriota bacterium]
MKRFVVLALACCALLAPALRAQVGPQSFARGQDISPTFDGWERNADGTFTLWFGYYNRNTEEEIDVPLGPDNTFDPGGDRGQPTHFYPSRKWWVFKTIVPADWPADRRAVWTLTTHGKTNQAKGWLQPEWEVDTDLISKNGARDPSLMTNGTNALDQDHENRPPVMAGSAAQTIGVSDTLALTVTATDDGRPKPVPDPEGRLQQGVRVRWIVYRGAGAVRFDPDIMSGRIYGKPATLATRVRFAAAGAYRLRAIASDGQAFSTYDVDVTVK